MELELLELFALKVDLILKNNPQNILKSINLYQLELLVTQVLVNYPVAMLFMQ